MTFRTQQAAIAFYRSCKGLRLPSHLNQQLLRAASSIALNVAEGAAKSSPRDQKRFYEIAMGSFRECQCIFMLEERATVSAHALAHRLGGLLYRLIQSRER